MCLYPKLIKNKKFEPNKKNGGVPPPVNDKRTLLVPVGCGKCMECMKKKANDWRTRLLEEIKVGNKCEFVTLTLSNDSYRALDIEINEDVRGYDRENEIITLATRRFLERWRAKTGKSVKHWLVSELGGSGTENIHLHGFLWTDKKELINETWKYGYTYTGEWVNEQTVNYCVKYVMKMDKKHKEYRSKILTSKGIGANYTLKNGKENKFRGIETREHYTTRQGNKIALPIYYRNKLYTDEEREKLWVNKIDLNIRYVDGSRIDLNVEPDEYLRALKVAQQKNKRLGYGDDSRNWEREEYENQRRELMRLGRLS